MTNEVVFDVAESVRALAADVINLVEDAGLDPQAGLSAGAFNGLQRRFMRVEDDTAQGALDVAEQAVLDRMSFGGWIMGDPQWPSQARAECHEILLEAQGTSRVRAAAIKWQDNLRAVVVTGMKFFLPSQCDGIADEGAGLAGGSQGHEADIVEVVVDAM